MYSEQNHSQDKAATPLISFVVTAFNLPEQLLSECIESIGAVDMAGQEREIIVVDDGSSTPVSGLPSHVRVIRQHHLGPGAARNCGINASRGLYIQFVDGDDRLLPRGYGFCVATLLRRQPDMLLFSFNAGGSLRYSQNIYGPMSGPDFISSNVLAGQVWQYAFRRSLLTGLLFPTDVTNHEDEEFSSLLWLRARKLMVTTCQAYFYRRRSSSLTMPVSPEAKAKTQDDFLKVISRLQQCASTLTGKEQQAMNFRLGQLAADYLITTIRLYHDQSHLASSVSHLARLGLYPLHYASYGLKYRLFLMLVSCRLGRRLLNRLL